MVALRWTFLAFEIFVMGCSGSAIDLGGSSGSGGGGAGGMDTTPNPGVNCTIVGCEDGNECTIDGLCESTSGVCVGAGPVPLDMPCGQESLFVCDGAGECVGCNNDGQCLEFFPDEECRLPPQCVNNTCPIPDPLPERTPCSLGECRKGNCRSPWAPVGQIMPMVCGASDSSELYEAVMRLSVAPTPISADEPFSALLGANIEVSRRILQNAVIASYPDPLPSIEVTGARVEVSSTGVVSGTPVATTVAPLPQELAIPQIPNPGDPGGTTCTTNEDCPMSAFGQICLFQGGSDANCFCACQAGCFPTSCANLVVAEAVLPMEPIQGAIYSPTEAGDVCFDVSGDAPFPSVTDRVRTGVRISNAPGPFAIECEGGSLNDNGTPEFPFDDLVDPNPPEEQICFPIAPVE